MKDEQTQTKSKRQKKTTLFTRITIRLTLPLFFLAAIFTGLLLTNQMNTLNQYYKIESRVAFDAIQKGLSQLIKAQKDFSDLGNFKTKLEVLPSSYRVTPIQIFDLFKRSSLFPGEQIPWDMPDYQAMEKSLEQKQAGKPYFVRIDKDEGRLVAYIPLQGFTENDIWIARTMFPLADLQDALVSSRWTLGTMIFLILLTGIIIGGGLAKSIVSPIRTLNEATQEIVEGHLGKHVAISTGDEIETLADTFNHMSESLQVMKQRAEDANPLTQLPGNQGIFYDLNKRIHEKQKFVLFHIDLDRFKIFNDTYGLARGDEVIKKTANLLKEVLREKGSKEDFIGHQGGDDFVLVVKPNRAKEAAEYLIDRFDHDLVKTLYRKEDYERGYVMAVDRRKIDETGEIQEKLVKFPLLAISLAGVSNAKKDFADYFDCLSRAVLVKKEVKKSVQSSYMIEE
jgi:diguanylate cyclase (GGDEF)-like protein